MLRDSDFNMSNLTRSPVSSSTPAAVVPAESSDENANMVEPLLDERQTPSGAVDSPSSYTVKDERRYKREISLLSMSFLLVFSAFGVPELANEYKQSEYPRRRIMIV